MYIKFVRFYSLTPLISNLSFLRNLMIEQSFHHFGFNTFGIYFLVGFGFEFDDNRIVVRIFHWFIIHDGI